MIVRIACYVHSKQTHLKFIYPDPYLPAHFNPVKAVQNKVICRLIITCDQLSVDYLHEEKNCQGSSKQVNSKIVSAMPPYQTQAQIKHTM